MPLKVTNLNISHPVEQQKQLTNVLIGYSSADSLEENKQKELKRLLAMEGLTMKRAIKRYKDIIDAKGVKFKGSDVLKALDAVREMHTLKENNDSELQIRALTQTKTANEIKTTLIQITGRTQDYINKLNSIEDE